MMPIVLSPPSSFCAVSTVTLDGVAYRLRLRYDERLTSWYVDAWNAVTGSPIVKGARLVDGTPAGTGRPGLWPGALGAMPVGRGARLDNAEDLMSGRSVLVYYPAAEIPAFSAGGFVVSGEWTPLALGPLVWLDPSDMATLFVDSAGTTPVVASGDPVGLWRNKGTVGSAGDAVQTVSAGRPPWGSGGLTGFTSSVHLLTGAVPSAPCTIIVAFRDLNSGVLFADAANSSALGGFKVSHHTNAMRFAVPPPATSRFAQSNETASKMFAATVSSDGDVRAYTRTGTDGLLTIASGWAATSALKIGGNPNTSASGALVRDIFTFNRVLSRAEINQLFDYLWSKHEN